VITNQAGAALAAATNNAARRNFLAPLLPIARTRQVFCSYFFPCRGQIVPLHAGLAVRLNPDRKCPAPVARMKC